MTEGPLFSKMKRRMRELSFRTLFKLNVLLLPSPFALFYRQLQDRRFNL